MANKPLLYQFKSIFHKVHWISKSWAPCNEYDFPGTPSHKQLKANVPTFSVITLLLDLFSPLNTGNQHYLIHGVCTWLNLLTASHKGKIALLMKIKWQCYSHSHVIFLPDLFHVVLLIIISPEKTFLLTTSCATLTAHPFSSPTNHKSNSEPLTKSTFAWIHF